MTVERPYQTSVICPDGATAVDGKQGRTWTDAVVACVQEASHR